MTDTEKLYETLGELLYVVAKSDGVIQEEEKAALENLLGKHPWAKEINWSFNYEVSKEKSIEDVYEKAIAVCHRIGPSPLYTEFIDAMNIIAQANNGIDAHESELINSFSADLIERFKNDIKSL